jgi:hypothetical protein
VFERRRQPQGMLVGLGEDAKSSVGKGHVRGSWCNTRMSRVLSLKARREVCWSSALESHAARDVIGLTYQNRPARVHPHLPLHCNPIGFLWQYGTHDPKAGAGRARSGLVGCVIHNS